MEQMPTATFPGSNALRPMHGIAGSRQSSRFYGETSVVAWACYIDWNSFLALLAMGLNRFTVSRSSYRVELMAIQ
jgi:hypothetical protein